MLDYRNTLVRTGKYFPLGRVQQIAIAPSEGWRPPDNDPLIDLFGRLMRFVRRPLLIAQSEDRSQILALGGIIGNDGYASLEDLPDPRWQQPEKTKEDIEGIVQIDPLTKREYRTAPPFNPAKHQAPLIPQRLRDRAEAKMEGTDFLVFSPLISMPFQPDIDNKMEGTVWTVVWGYNPADGTHPTLLVHERTGETHFFGGRYDIQRPLGEN